MKDHVNNYMQEELFIKNTKSWIDNIVIGLNLCPFAKPVFDHEKIRFRVSKVETEEELIVDLAYELSMLAENDSIETSFLIHPFALTDFEAYNAFLDLADDLIVAMQLEGVFQIASFHPSYQFSDSAADDVENYSNRSPYPMLHLLREASLDKAVESYPNTELIPERNKATLQKMGVAKIKELLVLKRNSPDDPY